MNIIDGDYVASAEDAIKKLKTKRLAPDKSIPVLTTSKIRNLFSMASEIYNDVVNLQDEQLEQNIIDKINYLKIKFLYETGRIDNQAPKYCKYPVRDFVECTKIIDELDNIGESKTRFIKFFHYFEALVAYHKFYGGKDN